MSSSDRPDRPDRPDQTSGLSGASDATSTTVFAGFRAPDVIIEAIRERANIEGISMGELIAYAYTRLLQLEETHDGVNLATLPEDQLRAAITRIQQFRESGQIAEWVRSWAGETRARQLHPPSPDERNG